MFNTECAGDQYKWDGICSTSVLDDLTKTEIRSKLVNSIRKCVFDSGGLEGQSNNVFDDEIKAFTKYEVFWTPTVTINNELYNGNLHCPNPVDVATCSIFAALCAAFAPETIPRACLEHREIGCLAGESRDSCGVCGGDGSSCRTSQAKSMAVGFIFIIILIVVIACGIGLYFKQRFIRAVERVDALRNMYEPLRVSEHVDSNTGEQQHLHVDVDA